MTHRDAWTVPAVALAPAALALVGHALQLDGPVLTVLVGVAWVGCVAATVRIWLGRRAR